MKFTEAAGANPTDAMRVLGRPTDRIEGPLKVSGRATYAAEFAVAGQAYGVVVGTSIATGRIVAIDATSPPGEEAARLLKGGEGDAEAAEAPARAQPVE